jgi:hypothetical protein
MTMPPPFGADSSEADGIPAADPGAGAPEPSPGFGIGGEEPDVVADEDAERPRAPVTDTPFRTPDPREIGPDAGR